MTHPTQHMNMHNGAHVAYAHAMDHILCSHVLTHICATATMHYAVLPVQCCTPCTHGTLHTGSCVCVPCTVCTSFLSYVPHSFNAVRTDGTCTDFLPNVRMDAGMARATWVHGFHQVAAYCTWNAHASLRTRWAPNWHCFCKQACTSQPCRQYGKEGPVSHMDEQPTSEKTLQGIM